MKVHEKGGPRRTRLFSTSYAVGWLPDDPAGEQATTNQKNPSADRKQRSTTGVRERRSSTAGRSRRSCSRTARGSAGHAARAAHAAGRSAGSIHAAQAAVDLALADAELLGNLRGVIHSRSSTRGTARTTSSRTTLGAERALHLGAVHVLGTDVTGGCLRESRSRSGQHHGQHRCQQHQLLQAVTSFLKLTPLTT